MHFIFEKFSKKLSEWFSNSGGIIFLQYCLLSPSQKKKVWVEWIKQFQSFFWYAIAYFIFETFSKILQEYQVLFRGSCQWFYNSFINCCLLQKVIDCCKELRSLDKKILQNRHFNFILIEVRCPYMARFLMWTSANCYDPIFFFKYGYTVNYVSNLFKIYSVICLVYILVETTQDETRKRVRRVHLSSLSHSRSVLVTSRDSLKHVGKSVPRQRKRECLTSLSMILWLHFRSVLEYRLWFEVQWKIWMNETELTLNCFVTFESHTYLIVLV